MAHYIGDNVDVGSDVAIASGVILEAAPGSRLIIESDVCIGVGAVIQAHGGDLIISQGTSLGHDVLVVGTGQIGRQTCVGAESTLINPHIEAAQVIAARSLICPGRPEGTTGSPDSNGHRQVDPAASPSVPPDSSDTNGNGALAKPTTVYGREQVMQLVKTLFPHREALNGNGPSDPSS